MTSNATLTRTEWDSARSRTTYFGHQSVGDNILDGLQLISKTEGWPAMNIVELSKPDAIAGPAISHGKIGQNGDPLSKVRGFREALDAGAGKQVDIALMKFCFWDVRHDTNIDEVFEEYQRTMSDLEQRYPRVTFIHATVPLVAADVDWKARLRRLIGMSTGTDTDNAARERLNQKIRQRYGSAVLLDIARAETEPGASANPPQLDADLSSDGAHLNDAGRRRVGAEFIKALASAAATSRLASRQ